MTYHNTWSKRIKRQTGAAIIEAAFIIGLLLFTLIAFMNILTLQEVRIGIQSSLLNSFNHIALTSYQRDTRGELHPVHCTTNYAAGSYDPDYDCQGAIEDPPDELIEPMNQLYESINRNLFRGENTPFTSLLNGEVNGGCAFKLFYMELHDQGVYAGFGSGLIDEFEWNPDDTNNMRETFATSDIDTSGITNEEWGNLIDDIRLKVNDYVGNFAGDFVVGERTTVMYEEQVPSLDDYFTWSAFVGYGCTIKTVSWGFFPMEITFTDTFVPNINLRLKN